MPKQCRQALIILVQKALIGHIKDQFWKLRENACDQKDHDNERFVFVLVDPMSQDFEPLLYPIPDRGHLKSPRSSFSRLSTSIRYTISSTVSLTWIKNNSYAFGRALQVLQQRSQRKKEAASAMDTASPRLESTFLVRIGAMGLVVVVGMGHTEVTLDIP